MTFKITEMKFTGFIRFELKVTTVGKVPINKKAAFTCMDHRSGFASSVNKQKAVHVEILQLNFGFSHIRNRNLKHTTQ